MGGEMPAGMSLGDYQFGNGLNNGVTGGSTPIPTSEIAKGDVIEPMPDVKMGRQTGIINKDTNQWAGNGEFVGAQRGVENAKKAMEAGKRVPGASLDESTKRLQAAEATLSKFGTGTQYQLEGVDEGQGVDLSKSSKMFPGNVTLPADQAASLKSTMVDKTYAEPVRVAQGFSADPAEAAQQQQFVRDFREKAGGLVGRLSDPETGFMIAKGPETYPEIKSYVDRGGTPESYADLRGKLNTAEDYAKAFGTSTTPEEQDERLFD